MGGVLILDIDELYYTSILEATAKAILQHYVYSCLLPSYLAIYSSSRQGELEDEKFTQK